MSYACSAFPSTFSLIMIILSSSPCSTTDRRIWAWPHKVESVLYPRESPSWDHQQNSTPNRQQDALRWAQTMSRFSLSRAVGILHEEAFFHSGQIFLFSLWGRRMVPSDVMVPSVRLVLVRKLLDSHDQISDVESLEEGRYNAKTSSCHTRSRLAKVNNKRASIRTLLLVIWY